ncbi:MAG: UPF0236 family transposase-like protein [Bacillota bacterium]
MALEEVDKRYNGERDQKRLKVVGPRERTISTSFGEVTFPRRLYRDKETGKARFLLDEA